MIKSSQILVITLLATLAITINGEKLQKRVENNTPEFEMLTQLKSKDTNSAEDIIIYKCTAGSTRTNRVSCSGAESEKWNGPHNAELVLRCPKSGYGDRITFAEIKFAATSDNIKCVISDGGIGMNHMAMTLNVWNTVKLDYSVKFYTN